jgi:phosphosulfolactate synthase (CoM biosynthesis protein A)
MAVRPYITITSKRRKAMIRKAIVAADYIDGIEWEDGTLNLIHMEERVC